MKLPLKLDGQWLSIDWMCQFSPPIQKLHVTYIKGTMKLPLKLDGQWLRIDWMCQFSPPMQKLHVSID